MEFLYQNGATMCAGVVVFLLGCKYLTVKFTLTVTSGLALLVGVSVISNGNTPLGTLLSLVGILGLAVFLLPDLMKKGGK